MSKQDKHTYIQHIIVYIMASTNTFNMEYILGLFIVLGNIEKIIELIKPLFYCCVFYFTTYRFFVVTERERMNTFKGKLKHETYIGTKI